MLIEGYVWDNEIGKYKFKNVGDILPGDRLVMQDETEVEVVDIEIVREDVEIVTVNVENADVYISNGLISQKYWEEAYKVYYIDLSRCNNGESPISPKLF